jgi:ABC-type branched-subunit amino acid transport system permease subunit
MSLKQMTGKQMDMYERVWTRLMIASGGALLIALFGAYLFRAGGTELLVCCIAVAVALVITLITAAKLKALERGLRQADCDGRRDLHAALDDLAD